MTENVMESKKHEADLTKILKESFEKLKIAKDPYEALELEKNIKET